MEKLSKYKDLEIELIKIWHLKSTTLPVIIGALGMVAKTAPNYVSQIPEASSLTDLQKIILMVTGKSTINVINVIYIYIYTSI